jgi:PAS domain S-box-containing protein
MSRLELNHKTKGSDFSRGHNDISVRSLVPELRNALQDVVGINDMPRVIAAVKRTIRDHTSRYIEKCETYRSQLKIMDEELRTRRQTEQRWRTAFENSAIGIFMADSAGRYVAANRAFLDMLGYTASELYRLSVLEATFEGDRKANLELINELMAGERQHFQMEKRYCRKDRSLVWVRSNVVLVPGIGLKEPFWMSVVEDITQRKLAEDKLRASERSLRELTETIPQMLWSTDADGANDYCNQRMLEYTGLSAEEVRGSGWKKAVHPDDVEKLVEAWKVAVSMGQPFQYEFRWFRVTEGIYRWCITSGLPLRDQRGRIVKWFGTVVDLHDWKQTQQALQTTQMELARVSRMTTMGELAASIAHEVNQPLTAVINNSNACRRLLADNKLDPGVLQCALEQIVAEATRAASVIARIRAFITKAPPERNRLDINEIIQEVLPLTARELDKNEVQLVLQLTEALPTVLGDRVQLQQVLLNLIVNAIEAMTIVKNRPRLLCVQSQVDQLGDVLVAVRDSGAGLNSDADLVFTPFFTTKAHGMGLGLSISRSLIQGHGGRLWIEPNSPHGTVFCFTLPAEIGGALD